MSMARTKAGQNSVGPSVTWISTGMFNHSVGRKSNHGICILPVRRSETYSKTTNCAMAGWAKLMTPEPL